MPDLSPKAGFQPSATKTPAAPKTATTSTPDTDLSPEVAFQQGLERYKAGAPVAELIPVFKNICDRAPKSNAAWTCLAWLYLLGDRPTLALKAAKRAVKLVPTDAQSRVNLAVAMLETQQKGVRQHIELIEQAMMIDSGAREEVESNLTEGLERNPNCKGLSRVKAWLFDAE